MTLDRRLPGKEPLARIGIFGNPYHGPVQGGVLTLPNSATKTWPQPGTAAPDLAGMVHLVKRPGQPDVVRSVEELAADAAAGREWRNAALLSGSGMQLHGQDVNGWIYVDPAGDRWLVQFTTNPATVAYSFTDPDIELSFKFSRFGVFGQSALETTEIVSISGYGQSGPSFKGFLVSQSPTQLEDVVSGRLMVDSITPDGSKVALMLHRQKFYIGPDDPPDPTDDALYRHPVGWLQLAISGPGSAPTLTLSVLKNRDETLQIVERTFDESGITTVSIDATDDHPGFDAASSGVLEWKIQYRKLISARPNEEGDGFVFDSLLWIAEGTHLGSYAFTGNVLTLDRDNAITETYVLEADGAEVDRVEVNYTVAYELSLEFLTGEGDPWAVQTETSRQRDASFDGGSYSQTVAGPPPSNIAIPQTSFTAIDSAGSAIASSVAFAFQELVPIRLCFVLGWRNDFRYTMGDLPGAGRLAVDLVRYSGRVFGFRFELDGDFVYLPRQSPSGETGSRITRPYDAQDRLYASWCPYSGQVADAQEDPICWV